MINKEYKKELEHKKKSEEFKKLRGNNPLYKNIHYTSCGTYQVTKMFNGNSISKTFKTIDEAINYRDLLIKYNGVIPEEYTGEKEKNYFKNIVKEKVGRTYRVFSSKGYIGLCNSLEEALFYRDLYGDCSYDTAPRPKDCDLITDNPYLDGLDYPVPVRLKSSYESSYGKGQIRKEHNIYKILYNHKYFCSCRTYEQAYFIRRELQKVGWDENELPRIRSEYPVFYTYLINFYMYIGRDVNNGKFHIRIPREFSDTNSSNDLIRGYANLEDALFERDFLVANGWDYIFLVENINDDDNPYYDMSLPPFPERKIKIGRKRDYHEEELTLAFELIQEYLDEGVNVNFNNICRDLDIPYATFQHWLNDNWDCSIKDFVNIALTGVNPIDELERVTVIYNPDLSRSKPSNFNNYIWKTGSKRSPYCICKDRVYYGSYHTYRSAKKAVALLKKCGWDHDKVSSIQEKVGYVPLKKRSNVYPNGKGWFIRRKIKGKPVYYGHYNDHELACRVRDLLNNNGWDKSRLDEFKSIALKEL